MTAFQITMLLHYRMHMHDFERLDTDAGREALNIFTGKGLLRSRKEIHSPDHGRYVLTDVGQEFIDAILVAAAQFKIKIVLEDD